MIKRGVGNAIIVGRKVVRRLGQMALRPLFKRVGRNVRFDPSGVYTFSNIELGDDVFIGERPHFSCTESGIRIGSKVMFGPRVMIFAGDHNTSVLGRFMYDVRDKRPGDDLPVTIEDDVWVGAGVIILKGVTVGRGSIVAAGSVVNRDVPSYAVVAGNPAQVKKLRWSERERLRHEAMLYGRDDMMNLEKEADDS